jgi:YVTN family beta-propeller protein
MKMKKMLCFPRQLLLGLICWLNTLIVANNVHAAFGDILAQYTFPASSLVMLPGQPLMYATIPSQNSVAIINTNTLVVEDTVFVGSGPTNLAFRPDGSKAYIANSTSNFVAVFDTQSRTVINSFLLPEHPQDVVFGNSNRLWVLGTTQIFQIDATTGASTGPSIDGGIVYSGSLEISPDRNTLYYADYGLSPGTMYKYDVTGTTPVLLLQTPFGTVGSNGEDLTLSYSGSFICYTTGSGNNNYDIAKFRTSDFASLGSFVTGPYPQALAFSPDDLVVYASVHTASGIKAFDANTFLLLGTMTGPEVASKLAVDPTGRDLFAGYDTYFGFLGTIVFDTGRTAATPTPTPTPTATPSQTPTPTATPTATPTPTPCTGRCSPTPRPRPTPAPRPTS